MVSQFHSSSPCLQFPSPSHLAPKDAQATVSEGVGVYSAPLFSAGMPPGNAGSSGVPVKKALPPPLHVEEAASATGLCIHSKTPVGPFQDPLLVATTSLSA